MYARPSDLDDALGLLAGGGTRVMAGATDIFPSAGERPLDGPYVDVSSLSEPRLARGFASREFDDLGRDFLLSDEPLAPLQLRKLAFDLPARRRHGLHARLIFCGEGMQSRSAELRVQIVRRQRANENVW